MKFVFIDKINNILSAITSKPNWVIPAKEWVIIINGKILLLNHTTLSTQKNYQRR